MLWSLKDVYVEGATSFVWMVDERRLGEFVSLKFQCNTNKQLWPRSYHGKLQVTKLSHSIYAIIPYLNRHLLLNLELLKEGNYSSSVHSSSTHTHTHVLRINLTLKYVQHLSRCVGRFGCTWGIEESVSI